MRIEFSAHSAISAVKCLVFGSQQKQTNSLYSMVIQTTAKSSDFLVKPLRNRTFEGHYFAEVNVQAEDSRDIRAGHREAAICQAC
jgi:hypothetical protein